MNVTLYIYVRICKKHNSTTKNSTFNSFTYVLLLGQQNSLHGSLYVLLPIQDKPPREGVGLLHDLVNRLIPPPQVLLQDPSLHELHPPSTTTTKNTTTVKMEWPRTNKRPGQKK